MTYTLKDINIFNQSVEPGERAVIKLSVGNLPSNNPLAIHAHVFRSGRPGPTVLVLGGVHGDEINGVEIVRSAMHEDMFTHLNRGSVIAIPLVNIYGFINFSRDVPDGKDVNRSFPGNLKGSVASRIARTITKYILPEIHYGLDFHTGGSMIYNHPQIRYSMKDPANLNLAKVFGPPYIIQKALIRNSLRKVCHDQGIPMLVFEGGESLRLDGYAIQKGKEGIQRILYHLEMIDLEPAIRLPSLHITRSTWQRANYSGLFEWTKCSGTYVVKGEPLGYYRDIQGLKQRRVYAKQTGYIIGHNNAPVINQGDALFHIGYDWEKIE